MDEARRIITDLHLFIKKNDSEICARKTQYTIYRKSNRILE